MTRSMTNSKNWFNFQLIFFFFFKPIIFCNFDFDALIILPQRSPWSDLKFTYVYDVEKYLWGPGWSRSKSWQLQGGLFDEKTWIVFVGNIWVWGRGTFVAGIRESKTAIGFGWDWHGSKGFWGQGHERACFWRTGLLRWRRVRDLDVHRWTGRSDQDWFGKMNIGLASKPWVVEDSFQVDSVTGWDG